MRRIIYIFSLFLHIMKRLAFFNFLIFTFFISACTGDEALIPMLERAEAYLPDCPDSAECVLDSMPSTPSQGEALALYGLLRTMTDAMQGKGVTTDSLIRPAYIYYNKESSSPADIRRLGRSAFYLAQYEASHDSTKLAESLYREAIKYSEEVEDWRTCYMAYSWFARIKTWSDTEEAICLLNTAIDIYHKVEDKPANLVSMLLDLSINHLALLNHKDSAFFYANQAYTLSCDLKLEREQYASLFRLSDCYYYTHDYPKALELAKQGMHGLTDQTRDATLFSLADCYLACDSLDQAKTILQSISSSDNKMRYSVFRKLSQIAMLQNESQLAVSFSDSTYQAVVSVFSESQYQKELYYKSLVDEELANERLIHHSQILRYSFIIILLAIVILVLISYRKIQAHIRLMNEKHRLNMLSHETLISELHARINQFNEQVAQNEQTLNRYQQLLEQKQSELQQLKMQATNTEGLKTRQQQYEQEISVLKQLYLNEKEKRQKIASESQQVITRLQQYTIGQSDLYKQIVNDQIRVHQIDDHDWRYVEYLLDSCSDRFASRLKKRFPRLTDEQYHLCLLSRMGLNRKQVASFMCLAEVTIKKKHQECKRTVFDITDPQSSFNDIIERF